MAAARWSPALALALLLGCIRAAHAYTSLPAALICTRHQVVTPRRSPSPTACSPAKSDEQSESAQAAPSAAPAPPARYDLKKVRDASGAGFNQFDPVLSLSGFLSRRFGIVGGLALVGILAATEGQEIIRALNDKGPIAGSGEVVTTPSGLQYVDVLIGTSGDSPLPGAVVGLKAKVSIGDQVLFDTGTQKPLAFKYGQRPFASVMCEGVEEGLKGMKPGGKRQLRVPAALAPKGVDLPAGVVLDYEDQSMAASTLEVGVH
uniref:peptidylprolyl isomerase n=1 Tax=Chrysotila carterae TaxID=13221 RepID=A0A7S4F3I0_CHRCT